MRILLAILLSLSAFAGEAKKNACLDCHDVAMEAFSKGVHGAQDCLSCHPGAAKQPHKGHPAIVDCSACHDGEVKAYQKSIHGVALKNGHADAAKCVNCHGPAHVIVKASDPTSPVAKPNLPGTCGACHSNPDFLAKHKLGLAHPVEAYRLSTHGREVGKGNTSAAGCSDCHGSHEILKAADPKSSIHRLNLSSTCGGCHSDVQTAFEASVHGRAVKLGLKGAPTCTDCHGEHDILAPSEAGSLVSPARVSAATCGRCHSDERLVARYALPKDKVEAFHDSFHGLSSKGGSTSVANCASCHGVHNILPSSDPKSMIHPANLGTTCGKCHPGTDKRFIAGPVHVVSNTASEHAAVRFIRRLYLWALIPMTLGFMFFHNLIDFIAKLRRRKPTHHTGEKLPRMNAGFRFAHGLVALSFILLVLTGFALKYPESFWAKPWLLFETRVPFRGWVHRVAAVVMIAGTLFHGLHLLFVKRDRKILLELMPGWQDLKDLVKAMAHNLGFKVARPTFGVFSYAEKMEYWAFMWGTVVMAVTGLLLWGENWSLQHFPKWVMDAATSLHWYEAILATFSILLWHWYAVIFDPEVYPMDTAWYDGMASGDHLKHTRPAYYARLKGEVDGEEGDDAP
jgi:cytochrome b subunit of formate dehydrogenase